MNYALITFTLIVLTVTLMAYGQDCDLGLKYKDEIPGGMAEGWSMELSPEDPKYCRMVLVKNGNVIRWMTCDYYFDAMNREYGRE